MRTKRAGINVVINFITYVISFLPVFIVRRVFLNTLGDELLGLSSLYTNIIGLLSIVELGIGTAIIFSLYKPFADNDRVKIKGYLNYYAKFYRIIGIIILVCGLLITPFLKIFINNDINILEAQGYFILFLLNTLISYMFSYKLSMLYVSQQGYIVAIGTTISKIIIAALQIILLKLAPDFNVYLIIQLVINLIYYLMINRIINKQFEWLNKTDGILDKEEKLELAKNIKALFIHKVGGLLVLSTDNIIISAFINLNVVSKYNSYNLVINSLQNVITTAFSSITASIGNLLTEKNDDKAYEVHKKLYFLNFWIASLVVISLFNTIKQFIILWLGKSQILDDFTVIIILINLYFMLMRSSVDTFKEAGGIYHQDRYSSLFEAGINLIFSIILVRKIGLPGVFIGTLISNFSVLFWVKPKMVYKYVFKKSLKEYYVTYIKYFLITLIMMLITNFATKDLREIYTISAFLLNCIVNLLIINISYITIFYRNKNFKFYKEIVLNNCKRILNKIK